MSAERYEDVATRLNALLPDDASALGPERWWWGLHELQYRAVNVVVGQWRADTDAPSDPNAFACLIEASGVTVLIEEHVRSEMTRCPPALRDQATLFPANDARVIGQLDDDTSGHFDLYQVEQTTRNGCPNTDNRILCCCSR